ncbi:MAG: glycoside hydrolase family 15 protein [Actinobacteria bacterium]|nr:glycoside hydrolase family 15 protein [Actinomycetota bacterium]
MALPIEDYALLSDLSSCALVGRNGSIDWLTFPRFDSRAAFAGILGESRRHGHWRIAPAGNVTSVERRYRDSSLVLETVFTTPGGIVAVIDTMPPGAGRHDVVRVVECRAGSVEMAMQLVVRFDYGSIVPWVRRVPGGIEAIGGPDGIRLATAVELRGEDLATVASFEVRAGERVPFSLSWFSSAEEAPQPIDAITAIEQTEAWWHDWASGFTYDGEYAAEVLRSAIVLKALTVAETGGIVAAPTTSLPEEIGGIRNWDYRYCWLRDATFSLIALQEAGFADEASAWRAWLLRSVAGDPRQLQIMYGPAGERRLSEIELDWLPGYDDSAPVRIGNAAHGQFQLDVYGEVLDAMYQATVFGEPFDRDGWSLQRHLVDYVATHWQDPDDGIWEVRGGRRHFTHSKVMAWVAVDRAIETVEHFGLEMIEGVSTPHEPPLDVDEWRSLRDAIKADVLAHGVNAQGAFVQSYGSDLFDASLLMVPLVGFVPADDPRVAATVAAIETRLLADGFVRRYETTGDDGLSGTEGTFLMCSFWLADNYALMGRLDDAIALFERLLALRNDVGLLAEEYDPVTGRMLGNFPQAFSHVALINTASHICAARDRIGDAVSAFPGTCRRRSHHHGEHGDASSNP